MKSNAFIDSIRDSSAVRLLVDAYPSYLSYVDRDYRYCFVNHAHEIVFGVAREAIVGKLVEDVWVPRRLRRSNRTSTAQSLARASAPR